MYLGVSKRINLVDGVARRPARLPVEVVALNEHRVIGLAPDPHVALSHKVQLRRRLDLLISPHLYIKKNQNRYFNTKFEIHNSKNTPTLSYLDALADVEPRPLACIGAMNVANG